MRCHHKGSPSIENKNLAAKTAKARKMTIQSSRAKACDISAMELRYGDWSVPVDGMDLFKTDKKPVQQEKSLFETLSMLHRRYA